MRKNTNQSFVSNQQLEKEFKRTASKEKRLVMLRRIVSLLILIVLSAMLMSILYFPIYHITGSSMVPTLEQGMIVVASRCHRFASGDVVSLNYGNQILISRLIGMPGDIIEIDAHGIVSVNDVPLHETYLHEQVFGASDLTYSYQVPERAYFVLGDNRENSIDSRTSAIGCIKENALDGKIIFCVWPLDRIGLIG